MDSKKANETDSFLETSEKFENVNEPDAQNVNQQRYFNKRNKLIGLSFFLSICVVSVIIGLAIFFSTNTDSNSGIHHAG